MHPRFLPLAFVLIVACGYRVELAANQDGANFDANVSHDGSVSRDGSNDTQASDAQTTDTFTTSDTGFDGGSNCFTNPQRFCALGQLCDTPPTPSAQRIGTCSAAVPELQPGRFAATIAIEGADGVSRILSTGPDSSVLHDFDRSPDGPALPQCPATVDTYGLRVIGESGSRFGACQQDVPGLLASSDEPPAILLETTPISTGSAQRRFVFRDAAPDCDLSAGSARMRIRVQGRWYTLNVGYIDITPLIPNANGPAFRASFQGTVSVGATTIVVEGRFYSTAGVYLC